MRELSLHLLDLVRNSIEAGAQTLDIAVAEEPDRDRLTLTVGDDGRGMDAELAARVLDPFATTRTTRRVGLGLPLLAAAAERSNGGLSLVSTPGKGTTVRAEFQLSHIDRAPLGDIAATLVTVIAAQPTLDITYKHSVGGRSFLLATADLRSRLGDVPLSDPEVVAWLRDYLSESIDLLRREA